MAKAKIKVPVGKLKEQAKKLSEYTDSNESMFDEIYNSIAALQSSGGWIGDDVKAAIDVTQKNKKKYKNLVDELSNLSLFLTNFAEAMDIKDNEYKRKIESSVR